MSSISSFTSPPAFGTETPEYHFDYGNSKLKYEKPKIFKNEKSWEDGNDLKRLGKWSFVFGMGMYAGALRIKIVIDNRKEWSNKTIAAHAFRGTAEFLGFGPILHLIDQVVDKVRAHENKRKELNLQRKDS